MMDTVYGLLAPDGQLSLLDSESGLIRLAENEAMTREQGRSVVIFVPAVDVNVQMVSLNARNERDARRSAPFAIEDNLAQAPEQVHVALGPEIQDGQRMICAARDDLMERWTSLLADMGLSNAALCAPQSLLTADGVVSSSQGMFGRAQERYFAIDFDAPEEWLQGLIASETELTDYRFGDDRAAYLAQLIDWYEAGGGLDLRQGEYAVRTSFDLERIKKWRIVGALAAAVGLAWIGSLVWSAQSLEARVADLERRAVQVVEAGWPDLNGDVDLALRDIRANGGAGQVAFPSATTATAMLYKAVGELQGSELRSLRYDRDRGQVLAIVAYRDFADGNRLAGAFEGSGLRARVGDARQSGAQVVAELVLEVAS
ncbi:MAG: type II secretion system protein GspL [Pseudomonadota bacterium]